MSYYWVKEPWANVDGMVALVNGFYSEAIKRGLITDPMDTASRKLVAARGWVAVTPAEVHRVVDELEIVYLPNGVGPGPGIMFPIRDLTGEIRRLHIRLQGDGPEIFKMKYMALMDDKEDFLGPTWIGADEDTLKSIISSQEVLLVEGPLDLAAVRVAGCPVPSLSTTSKKVTRDHWDYLRVLGVRTLHVMFDIELSGVGEKAAAGLARNNYGVTVNPLHCPSKDPAECLQNGQRRRDLADKLAQLGQPAAPTVVFDL